MDTINLLSELVKIRSYSGEERKLRQFIKNWMTKRGIEVFEQGENLVVYLKGTDRTRALVFNSHMDTVSAGEESAWTYGPFNPTKKGNKLIGLGTSDMKSGLAASMLVAEGFSSTRRSPIDLWFTYVTNEEVDGSGTKSFAEWFARKGYHRKYKSIAAIFTEPTGLVEIEHGHRGNYFIEVKTTGLAGHASRPDKIRGITAVRKMINFADALQNEVGVWRREFPDKYFSPSVTVGEMTSIRANVKATTKNGDPEVLADSPNKFASSCVATFDLRTTPYSHNIIYKKFKALAKKMGAKASLLYDPGPSGFTDPKREIIKVLKSFVKKTKLTVSQGSADLGFLTARGIKAVIFGPGEKEQSHKINEFCYPSQISDAVRIYRAVVEKWANE